MNPNAVYKLKCIYIAVHFSLCAEHFVCFVRIKAAEIKSFILSCRFGLLYSSIGTVDWTAVQWLGLTKIKAFVLSCIFDVLYSSVCTVDWTGTGAGAGRDKGRT